MRVALVGSHQAGWQSVPWDDADLQIWTIPRLAHRLPRVDCVIELHGKEVADQYAPGVAASGAAVLTHADVPKWRGPIGNSFAGMLAVLEDKRPDVVELYASPHNGEYMEARESVMYWIGRLRGSGIPVVDHSGIADWGYRYGEEVKGKDG